MIWDLFTHDIAIDLGTANTLVALKGHGVIINEPSFVAVNKNTQQVLAVGSEAKSMIGRTPSGVVAVRPLLDGVISDFDTTEAMIRYFIRKAHKLHPKLFQIAKPRVLMGVPSSITEVEMNAVLDASRLAGARKTYIVEEAVAAAIGSGLNIEAAEGQMVVDIGGGTTDIAILSLGGIVIDKTIKIAGDEMNEQIVEYASHKYNIQIGVNMAEELKIKIGDISTSRKAKKMQVRGRDILSGLPKVLEVSSVEVREALLRVVNQIVSAIQEALENSPPEILSDLLQSGILLAGGGAQLAGIGKYLSDKLHTPVRVSNDPMQAVINGLIALMNDFKLLDKVQVTESQFI